MTMPGTVEHVADELRRLGGCADIPMHRRRALLALAQELSEAPPSISAAREPFFDPYYRREGYRFRRIPQDEGDGPITTIVGLIAGNPSKSSEI